LSDLEWSRAVGRPTDRSQRRNKPEQADFIEDVWVHEIRDESLEPRVHDHHGLEELQSVDAIDQRFRIYHLPRKC